MFSTLRQNGLVAVSPDEAVRHPMYGIKGGYLAALVCVIAFAVFGFIAALMVKPATAAFPLFANGFLAYLIWRKRPSAILLAIWLYVYFPLIAVLICAVASLFLHSSKIFEEAIFSAIMAVPLGLYIRNSIRFNVSTRNMVPIGHVSTDEESRLLAAEKESKSCNETEAPQTINDQGGMRDSAAITNDDCPDREIVMPVRATSFQNVNHGSDQPVGRTERQNVNLAASTDEFAIFERYHPTVREVVTQLRNVESYWKRDFLTEFKALLLKNGNPDNAAQYAEQAKKTAFAKIGLAKPEALMAYQELYSDDPDEAAEFLRVWPTLKGSLPASQIKEQIISSRPGCNTLEGATRYLSKHGYRVAAEATGHFGSPAFSLTNAKGVARFFPSSSPIIEFATLRSEQKMDEQAALRILELLGWSVKRLSPIRVEVRFNNEKRYLFNEGRFLIDFARSILVEEEIFEQTYMV